MMPISFLDGKVVLYPDDCRNALKLLPDNHVDSVCVDPPYHLTSIGKRFGGKNSARAKHGTDGAFARASAGFMGKQWDGGNIAFQSELWAEVLRVLKPGGYLMAFGGCRTYHRMACAIEDAGFVTHPFFAWAFGSGFPKAHSVSKQIDRAAGIKREIVGREKVSDIRNGHGRDLGDGFNASNRDGPVYFERSLTASVTDAARAWDGWFYGTQSLKPALEPIYFGQKPFSEKTGAANVLRWGTGAINVDGCRVVAAAGDYSHPGNDGIEDRRGVYGKFSNGNQSKPSDLGRWPANLIHDSSEEVLACFPESSSGFLSPEHQAHAGYSSESPCNHGGSTRGGTGTYAANSGSAARFFYAAKADSYDRLGSKHPTVKPIDLIQYLVRLITPPGGLVLDCFAGTGTTGDAAFREGFRAVLIEREEEYQADIARRMELALSGPATRRNAVAKARSRGDDAGPLFSAPPQDEGGADLCTKISHQIDRANWNEEVA